MPRRASSENVVKLTKSAIAALVLPPGQSERIVWDQELRGFGLRLRESGNRTWVIRPPRSGRGSKLHTLGPADQIDIGTARRKAQEKLAEAALGGDPTQARKDAQAKLTTTFGNVVAVYLSEREKHLRPSTLSNMRHHFDVHWKPLQTRPLSAITRAEVAARHREIGRESPHAADRAASILSTFYGWAMRAGLTESNPATNLNKATQPTRRERVLSDDELAAVWRACRDDDFGRIVRLLILTGLRRNEVAGMRWDEIDFQNALWTIPATRMKNKRPHEVPLSRAAMEILAAAPVREGRALVFGDGAGAFSGFSRAKKSLEARMGASAKPWGLHDLRRTTATGMNTLGVLPHVVEEVLSHVSGHKAGVAGIYNRATYRAEKRDALDRWAGHVAAITA